MNPDDPLAQYRTKKNADEVDSSQPVAEEKAPDPLDKYRENPNKGYIKYKDVISEELRAKGVEPDITEEFERMYEQGEAEAMKGLISGATLGISKLVPGLKPKENPVTTGLELVGSALPITKVSKGIQYLGGKVLSKPLALLASKSPIVAKSIQSLASLTNAGATGSVVGAVDEATESGEFKSPTLENVLDNGLVWSALDAGLSALGFVGRFAKNLLKKSKSTNKYQVDILNETLEAVRESGVDMTQERKVAEKALSILENKPLAEIQKEIKLSDKPGISKTEEVAQKELLQNIQQGTLDLRTRKIEQQQFNKLDQKTGELAEPYLPKEFDAEKIAEGVIDSELEASIESIAPRAETEQQLGKNVQLALEDANQAAKNIYNPLYEEATEGAKNIYFTPFKTANKAVELLQRLEGLKVKPPGYEKVINDIIKTLEDTGFVIRRSDANNSVIEAIAAEDVSGAKIMELKRRLNKMANFDNIESSIQDQLAPLAAAAKQDILSALKENPKALEAFKKAETKFGETAEKFKRKSIKSARYSEKPESIAKLIKTPSALEDIKKIVSKEQYAEIERELLEHMKKLSEDRAKSFFREMRPHLTNNSKSVGERIIQSKAPLESSSRKVAQRNKIQDLVYEDLSKATITGQRPEATLKLWKTREGQQLIKNSLKGNKNEAEVLKYLEDQSLADFSASVIGKDGIINFDKFAEYLKDPATVENLRLIGGDDAVNFFRQLETLSTRIEKNASMIAGKIDKMSAPERKRLEKEINEYGQKRLEKAAEESKKISPEQKEFQRIHGEEASKARKAEEKNLTAKGEERFAAISKANEDKEKRALIYKIDDFLKSYGVKVKGLLTVVGAIKFGTAETLTVVTAYEALKWIAKSKKARDAFRKAASKSNNVPLFINALNKLNDTEEE